MCFSLRQPLCEDEGCLAGGAAAAGGQDPAGRRAAEGAEGEPGTGAGNGHGHVDGIRTILGTTKLESREEGRVFFLHIDLTWIGRKGDLVITISSV